MRKHLKKVSMVMVPVFMMGMLFACNAKQVNTAKNIIQQADFYVDMANALVQVAATQFADKPDVQKALQATVAALGVVRAAMSAASVGLDKDYSKLKAAVIGLVIEVFALSKAIKDARASSTTSP